MKYFFTEKNKNFLEKNGYLILKNFLNKNFTNITENFFDHHTFEKIQEWNSNCKKQKKILFKKKIHKNFIKHYLDFKKPKYVRQPRFYCRNKYFIKVATNPKLIEVAKFFLDSNKIWLSGTYNFRYKSSYFPWSKLNWHSDITYWKEVNKKNFDFLIFWMTSRNLNSGEGSVELVPRNQKKINMFEKKFKYNKIFIEPKYLKNLVKKKIKISKFDLLILNSKTIHRSIPYKQKNILWTLDLRYERDSFVSSSTKKYGFKIDKNMKKNINNFIKTKPKFLTLRNTK